MKYRNEIAVAVLTALLISWANGVISFPGRVSALEFKTASLEENFGKMDKKLDRILERMGRR